MEQKSKTTTALLCFFLGGLGLHKRYMGYKKWWIYPITLGGGFGIMVLIDFYKILTDSMVDASGQKLSK